MQFPAKWSLYRNRIIGLNFHMWMGRGALALDERAEDPFGACFTAKQLLCGEGL